jgi:hypothetical protein
MSTVVEQNYTKSLVVSLLCFLYSEKKWKNRGISDSQEINCIHGKRRD